MAARRSSRANPLAVAPSGRTRPRLGGARHARRFSGVGSPTFGQRRGDSPRKPNRSHDGLPRPPAPVTSSRAAAPAQPAASHPHPGRGGNADEGVGSTMASRPRRARRQAGPDVRHAESPRPTDRAGRARAGPEQADASQADSDRAAGSGRAIPGRAIPGRAISGRAGSAAAGASAAASAAPGRCGRHGRGTTTARDGDGGEEFDRVGVSLRAGRGCTRLGHRAVDLERVATGAAPEVVSRHPPRVETPWMIRCNAVAVLSTAAALRNP